MAASWQLLPMGEAHLEDVLKIEQQVQFAPWSRVNFTDALAAGNQGLVMEADGRVLGYAVVLFVLDEAHLLNVAIAPDAQRRGLGRAFLAELHERARNAGARSFFLEVRESNLAARGLYGRLGYEPIGCRKRYYAAANGREDAIVMKKAL